MVVGFDDFDLFVEYFPELDCFVLVVLVGVKTV